ncbi:hypothetical protein TSOC_002230 [Tetrabaena socialis]|uniref:Telomerase activating protein Est1-like N-terminal domain-containing protein n=1 Tax=Tetrabaena socialis TaxID=47790 RepID=A0A2J8AEP4_9CHLO|nr:hypothetical protein TSOC_002230 [Tetrabaena socialis]|eukprot:PNH10984.1 hypothetical protein TSOC_002230 [Tetrabaena socialis]
MLRAPPSPTAAPLPAAGRPPPLTPYRGTAPPVSGSTGPGSAHPGPSASNPAAGRPGAVPGTGAAAAAAAGGGPFRGPAPPLWDQALEQEKRLRAELRKKSFWDPEVRRLRGALQGTYEALVFGHYEYSTAHEVEPSLWKAVFYRPIEEFRSRVRALEGLAKGAVAAVGGAGAAGAAPPPLSSPEEARAQLARTTGAYLRFLDEALAFYRKTVWKLQWVYGSVGALVDLDAALQNEIQECVPRASGARAADARQSVHRCLIYLGDLCRRATP